MKKMNKKGFTLIELLAIIVILAIIAVITVPIILNIIDEAKKGAEKNSVIGYGKAVELAYTQYLFEQSTGVADANNTHIASALASPDDGKRISISIDGTTKILKIDFDGDKVVCAVATGYSNTITSGVVSLQNCSVNGSSTTYSYASGTATNPSATSSATSS